MNTVVLEVRSLSETLAGAAHSMNTGRAEHEAHIGFSTPELLWQVLTSRRWQLLKVMCGAGPMSIREAARRVGRDVKAVHGDVMALLNAGLIDRTPDGRVEFSSDRSSPPTSGLDRDQQWRYCGPTAPGKQWSAWAAATARPTTATPGCTAPAPDQRLRAAAPGWKRAPAARLSPAPSHPTQTNDQRR